MRNIALGLGAALALALAGCAPTPAERAGWVSLPPDAVIGAGDPTRSAIISTAYAFGAPAALADQPGVAARRVAELEYLATEIPTGPRWREFDPTVGLQLIQAREEARTALGIAPTAPPQAVVDALYGVSRALAAGNPAAARQDLAPPTFPDGTLTLARLANLPPLPKTNVATSRAMAELDRLNRTGRSGGGGDSGGGKP